MLNHLVIRRSEWLRGQLVNSCLLRGDGRRCCVGIYLAAVGVPDPILRPGKSIGTAAQLDTPKYAYPDEARWLSEDFYKNSPIANELYEANDDPAFDQLSREARIAELFARQGITVQFTDE